MVRVSLAVGAAGNRAARANATGDGVKRKCELGIVVWRPSGVVFAEVDFEEPFRGQHVYG
jgi:hypothetical protein